MRIAIACASERGCVRSCRTRHSEGRAPTPGGSRLCSQRSAGQALVQLGARLGTGAVGQALGDLVDRVVRRGSRRRRAGRSAPPARPHPRARGACPATCARRCPARVSPAASPGSRSVSPSPDSAPLARRLGDAVSPRPRCRFPSRRVPGGRTRLRRGWAPRPGRRHRVRRASRPRRARVRAFDAMRSEAVSGASPSSSGSRNGFSDSICSTSCCSSSVELQQADRLLQLRRQRQVLRQADLGGLHWDDDPRPRGTATDPEVSPDLRRRRGLARSRVPTWRYMRKCSPR